MNPVALFPVERQKKNQFKIKKKSNLIASWTHPADFPIAMHYCSPANCSITHRNRTRSSSDRARISPLSPAVFPAGFACAAATTTTSITHSVVDWLGSNLRLTSDGTSGITYCMMPVNAKTMCCIGNEQMELKS